MRFAASLLFYLVEGDILNAVLSVIALSPITDLAAKAGRRIINIARIYGDDIAEALLKILRGGGKYGDEALGVVDGKIDEVVKAAGKLDNLAPSDLSKLTTDQLEKALPDGWTLSGSPDGRFVHVKDASGNYRIRIDPPDNVTTYNHIHIFDSNGNALDINGNIVPADSPAAHIPR